MRVIAAACVSLLTACSSTHSVRCDRHLTPINVPRRPLADALAPRSQAKEMKEASESEEPKSRGLPKLAAGGEGSP